MCWVVEAHGSVAWGDMVCGGGNAVCRGKSGAGKVPGRGQDGEGVVVRFAHFCIFNGFSIDKMQTKTLW